MPLLIIPWMLWGCWAALSAPAVALSFWEAYEAAMLGAPEPLGALLPLIVDAPALVVGRAAPATPFSLLEAAWAAALGDFEPPPPVEEGEEGDEGDLEPEEELEGDLEVPAGELGPCPAPEGPRDCPPWPVEDPEPVEDLVVVVPVVVPERSTPLDEALSSA